jgi:uncharacterized protein (DUF885 family)
LIATFVVVALGASFASAKTPKTLSGLSVQVLESLQEFYPVKSTQMGIHAYDHRLTDYSSKAVKNMTKTLTDYEKKLYKYKSARLSVHDRINYKLAKSNVDIALLELKRVAWHKKSPQLYVDEAVDGLYSLLLSQHAPMSEKVVSIINRMKAVPALFATARTNLKKVPPVYREVALESLESCIRFYKDASAELMKQFPERADNILKVSTQAREAMTEFTHFLEDLPSTDDIGFAIGKDNYDYMLAHQYFLDFDADSLLKIGEALLAEADSTYREYEEYVEADHQNGRDSVFVPANFTKQDIFDYYNWETRQVKVFLEEHDIVDIPENIAPVTVVETPPFLRSMIPGIAYQPAGPFDSVQQAYFYVRPIPDDLDRRQLEARFRYVHRRGFKGSVTHEAYPGHHLQMQLAGMNPDPLRKWQQNLLLIEGWALYCEEMVYEAGLFGNEDPVQWLGVLGGIRFRAARIVADVKLHTGQFSYDECLAWMIETLDASTESDRAYLRKEVRKMTLTPTNRMTYLMGKREIMRLRTAAEQKDGGGFSLPDFHDALLSEGSIPPTLMWEILGLSKN